LRLVESQLLNLARKYGVKTVTELDAMVQSGQVHEAEAFEDYFEFDHLEAERSALRDSLKELN
jgi:elongation factor P--beta-lysine ligase